MGDITVCGVWIDKELFWEFSLGKLSHKISDKEIKGWLFSKSEFKGDNCRLPHDGCIRKLHTDSYINNVLNHTTKE